MAGYGSLIDVKTKWTIDDLLDAHEVLDIQEESQRYYAEARGRS